MMLVNYYITQARGEEVMPSGSLVCLTSQPHFEGFNKKPLSLLSLAEVASFLYVW